MTSTALAFAPVRLNRAPRSALVDIESFDDTDPFQSLLTLADDRFHLVVTSVTPAAWDARYRPEGAAHSAPCAVSPRRC